MSENKVKKRKSAASTNKKDFSKNRKASSRVSKKKHPASKKRAMLQKKKLEQKKRKQRLKRLLVEIGLAMGITVIFLFIFSIFFYQIDDVSGYSMVPTFHDGDKVFINKRSKIKTFDLVYIKHKDTKKVEIRRVIGCPGDTVEYKEDVLLLNGESKPEIFIQTEKESAHKNGSVYTQDFLMYQLLGQAKVPENQYFVLGDNRPYTTDSRSYGLIQRSEILGVVKMRIWPLHKINGY